MDTQFFTGVIKNLAENIGVSQIKVSDDKENFFYMFTNSAVCAAVQDVDDEEFSELFVNNFSFNCSFQPIDLKHHKLIDHDMLEVL